MKGKVSLTVTKYFTPEGKHNCALEFESGEVCTFYRTKRFGTYETGSGHSHDSGFIFLSALGAMEGVYGCLMVFMNRGTFFLNELTNILGVNDRKRYALSCGLASMNRVRPR